MRPKLVVILWQGNRLLGFSKTGNIGDLVPLHTEPASSQIAFFWPSTWEVVLCK